MDRRPWCSPWGCKKLDTTEVTACTYITMEMDYSKWWAGKITWRDCMERT